MMKVTNKGVFGVKTIPFTQNLRKAYDLKHSEALYKKSNYNKIYGKPRKLPGV